MIKEAKKADSAVLAELALHMWQGHTFESLRDEFEELTEGKDSACFIKYAGDRPVGFAQCGLRRDYVEGTETSPVGYLEGIFILEEFRLRGYAKALLRRCESWAKEKRCREFPGIPTSTIPEATIPPGSRPSCWCRCGRASRSCTSSGTTTTPGW